MSMAQACVLSFWSLLHIGLSFGILCGLSKQQVVSEQVGGFRGGVDLKPVSD